jgi:hypothetical protein
VTARADYRDWDGKTRLVQAAANPGKAAERALKAKLTGRTFLRPLRFRAFAG